MTVVRAGPEPRTFVPCTRHTDTQSTSRSGSGGVASGRSAGLTVSSGWSASLELEALQAPDHKRPSASGLSAQSEVGPVAP
jgi:hypothetical protein